MKLIITNLMNLSSLPNCFSMPNRWKGAVISLWRWRRFVLESQNSSSVYIQDFCKMLPVKLFRRRRGFIVFLVGRAACEHVTSEIKIHGGSIWYEPVQLKILKKNTKHNDVMMQWNHTDNSTEKCIRNTATDSINTLNSTSRNPKIEFFQQNFAENRLNSENR